VTRARAKVVVLGMMSKMPVAGVVWQTVHYLLGLRRLGFECWYVEAHRRTPSMLMQRRTDDGSRRAAALIADVMGRFDFGARWAYHALDDGGRCFGIEASQLRRLYRDADLLLNLHGGTEPRPELFETGRLAYVETDPVQLQIELHDGLQATYDFLDPHCAFFTFAENLHGADCGLPVCDRYEFRATRQPVVVDLWAGRAARPGSVYTTIGNWRQPWRSVRYGGDRLGWTKNEQFERFLDLPARTGRSFELALSSYEPADRNRLEAHGWRVRDALRFSTDVEDYRRYVCASRAEFTAAKEQNVRFRTGWFSDRSATYLAAGRPVVTQDTGFGAALPTGEGLMAVADAEEAASAVAEVEADYARHSRAALEIAREYFEADRVLAELVEHAGLRPSRRWAPVGGAA
jgi:hypothetical protein